MSSGRAGWLGLALLLLAVPAWAQLPADLTGYERWKVLRSGDLPTEGVHLQVKDHDFVFSLRR